MDIIVDSFMQNFPQKINLLGRLIHSAVIIALIVALIFIFGFIIDHLKKDSYKLPTLYYRKAANQVGGGEEYYYHYWLWQPNKRKVLAADLYNNYKVRRVYTRKARQRHSLRPSKIPFLREVYGNVGK